MKTNILYTACKISLVLLLTAGWLGARADNTTPAKTKTYNGVISSWDANNRVLDVKGLFVTRKFVLSETCDFQMGDQHEALANQLRPGRKVEMTYLDNGGVLVASHVAEVRERYSGEVISVDQPGRQLTLRSGGQTRTFGLSDDCQFALSGGKSAWDDVQLGQRVSITYETPYNSLVAHRIEQKGSEVVGSMDAIDPENRTVSLGKGHAGDRTFHLTSDCAIVIDGKRGGRLSDLQPGSQYELTYETVEGVNIVNRISTPKAATPAVSAKNTAKPGPMGDY